MTTTRHDNGDRTFTLVDTQFEDAWTLAVDEGRVVSLSLDMRPHFEDLHLMNPDLALRTLANLPVPRTRALDDAAAGVGEKPAGRVDEHGRVLLPAGTDRDELLADELALRKAWRVLRDHDDRVGREGGQRSGYDTSRPDPTDRFSGDWRAYVDSGRDLVGTLKLRAWQAAQDQAARAQVERDERDAADAGRKAAEARALRELKQDQAEYAALVADAAQQNARNSYQQVIPPTFDLFEQRRRAERAASRR